MVLLLTFLACWLDFESMTSPHYPILKGYQSPLFLVLSIFWYNPPQSSLEAWSCISNLWNVTNTILNLYRWFCVVCSSSIYGFWLPLWYLQTLLMKILIVLIPCNDVVSGIIFQWRIVARTIQRFIFEVINTEVLQYMSMIKYVGCKCRNMKW